jgi:Family of unknown function (DUF6502)
MHVLTNFGLTSSLSSIRHALQYGITIPTVVRRDTIHMETRVHNALVAAIFRILRPLVRLLLRHGIPFGVMADVVKQVYVDVAFEEFGLSGRKQTASRVAIITGLSRKEVARLRSMNRWDDHEAIQQYNRAARVMSAWVRDPEFHDASGQPAPLPVEGDQASFGVLVRRYSGDMPVRAILDELLRVRAVELLEDGRIRLLARSYVPAIGEVEKLGILGTDVADLIATIDWNLCCPSSEAYFQRKVQYDNLPSEVIPELHTLIHDRAQAFIEQLDLWMAARDRDVTPTVRGTGRKRAMVGIYYFEEDFRKDEQV